MQINIAPIFVTTPMNDRIEEAVTRGSNGKPQRPAFYTMSTPVGKIYAGSTGNIVGRLGQHRSALGLGKHPYDELQTVVKREEPVEVTVEYMPSREAAFDAEQEFLTKNAGNPNLLNKALNARTPATGTIGKPPTPEHLQRLIEINTGKIVSEETRQKMSDARKGTVQAPATREAIMKANGNPVEINGVSYSSVREAGRALGVTDGTVSNRIKSSKPKFSNYSLKEKP